MGKEEEDAKILVRAIEAIKRRDYKEEYYRDGFVIHTGGDEESRLPDILLEYTKMSLDDGLAIDDILDEDHLVDYLARRPIQIQESMDEAAAEDGIDWTDVGDEINYTIKLSILLVMGDVRMKKELMNYIRNIVINAIKVVEGDILINASTEDGVGSTVFSLLLIGEVAKTLKVHEYGVEREKPITDIHNAVMSKEIIMGWGEDEDV